MSDIFSKILGIVLAFILLAFAPLAINSLSNDLTMKRASLNEVTNFINKVTDTGKISSEELKDFYLGCVSHGAAADVKIKRYMKVVNPVSGGGTETTYVLSEDMDKLDQGLVTQVDFNKGDVVQVTFKAIDWTGSQRILGQLLRLSQPKFEFTLAGKVR